MPGFLWGSEFMFRLIIFIACLIFSAFSSAERAYSPKTLQGPVAPFSHLYGSGYASLDAALAAANLVSHNAGCFDWSITATFQPSAVGSYHAADMHTDSQGKSSCGTFTKPITAYAKMLCPEGYTADTSKADTDPQACWTDTPPPPPPSDCSSKIGQTFTQNMVCGTVNCPSGLIADSSGQLYCNPPGSSYFSPVTIPQSISDGTCVGVYTSQDALSGGTSASPGDVRGPLYCNVTYTYTGESASTDTPTNNSSPPSSSLSPSSMPDSSGGGSGGGGTGGGGAGGDSGGSGGGTTGTGGGTQAPCVPTAENPCTQTGGGSYDCVPTDINPCNGAGNAQTANCDVTPVCTGDAVQCGQLVQTWKSVCQVHEDLTKIDDSTQQKLDQLKSYDGSSDPTFASSESLLDSHLSDFEAIVSSEPSGQCLSDIHIAVLTASITIPLSQICGFLTFLKMLLHLGCDYIALRIIARAVSGG